jgi:hypothetical protein
MKCLLPICKDGETNMELRVPPSKTIIEFVAGVIGLLFDHLEGMTSAAAADDLTLINGIGPTYAQRLKDAGIATFAQLAALTPEEVREITHVAAWQGDATDWVAQAKQLA